MVRISHLRKTYAAGEREVDALADVSLNLARGSFTALLGRSGCGKTTLLRLLAGLEYPSSGTIETGVASERVGYVFQEPRLMPWLTVQENICFAKKGRARTAFGDVWKIMQTLGLSEFAKAMPSELSGGMAQRAALGRTLFCDPDLILMDEPFGALDWFTRRGLQEDLLRLWSEGDKTILLVTHDIDEALLTAENVVSLREGRVVDSFEIPLSHPRQASDLLVFRERALSAIL